MGTCGVGGGGKRRPFFWAPPPHSFVGKTQKKTAIRGKGPIICRGIRLFDFTMVPHESFLAKSAHIIYYALPLNHSKKSGRLIYYVLAPSLGGGCNEVGTFGGDGGA